METLLSIILPTYNREHIIGNAVKSILRQTYHSWELIIVDDSEASNELFFDKFGDNRIHYIHRGKKLGVGSARNLGTSQATGKYLIFLDDDDSLADKYLEDFARLIKQANGNLDLAFCGMKIIGMKHRKFAIVLPSQRFAADPNSLGIVLAGAFLVRKDFFLTSGGYDNKFLFGENTELFFRFREMNPRKTFTDSINFIRDVSLEGASKNLINIVESNKLMLKKHEYFFKRHPEMKRKFKSITGVCLLRLGKLTEARYFLREAWADSPLNVKAFVRWILTFSLRLSRVVYN